MDGVIDVAKEVARGKFDPKSVSVDFDAHGNLAVISDRAKEQKEVLSGLEPLNPDRTTRNGKSVPVDPRFPSQIEKSDAKQSA